MQTFILRTALALMTGTVTFAQTPELIRGLFAMNAASLAAEGLPAAGVAPGARFALLGRNLGSTLEHVTARVTIDGASLDATLLSVTPQRIDALLPLHAPLGLGSVALEVNGTQLTAPIRIVERAFGISSEPVPGANGRRLRGTGLGRDRSPAGIEVIVAGQSVPAGGVTSHPDGWEDIDFDVPTGTESCATPVGVRINGRVSNTAIFATADDCPAPGSGSREDRNTGTIVLSRTHSAFEGFSSIADLGDGAFLRGPGFAGSYRPFGTVQAGSCTLQYFIEQDAPEIPFQELDAGPRLDVRGPKGTRDLERRSKGHYTREFGQQLETSIPGLPQQSSELYLERGEYTITGFGGADVGPFSTRITVPAPTVWTNTEVAASIDRARDLQIEWRDGSEQQIVTFQGASVAGERPQVAAAFTCAERGDKGALTVPASFLSALPATQRRGDSIVTFSVAAERPVEFTATGLDGPGTLSYSQAGTNQAQFR